MRKSSLKFTAWVFGILLVALIASAATGVFDTLYLRPGSLPSAGTLGHIRLDSSDSKPKFWDGTEWEEIGSEILGNATIGGTLGVTGNTTLSGTLGIGGNPDSSAVFDMTSTTKGSRPCPSMTEAQRDAISSPATGLCVFNTDTATYNAFDGSDWKEMGSGGGGGSFGINYIENGNADTTSGWNSYSDGTASPISCGASEGGSALVRDTTNVIRPKASFTTDTVAGDGAGYAYDFTIAEADKGGALVISLESRFLTGTFLGNWSIWICDMEADGGSGELINVFGEFTNGEDERGQDLIPSTEIRKQTFYFFPTDASNYRLLLHNGSEPMGANSELNYDSVSVGPQLTTPGFIGSAREAFTPTGSWTTNTSYSGHRTRVGDHLEGDVIVALSGAPDNTTLTLTVPDGLSIDTSKAPQDTPVGYAFLQDTDNATNNTMATVFVGSTSTVLSLRVVGGTDIGQSTPFSWGSGDTIRIYFTIPIEGWNASAALSTTSAALETVKAFGTGSGSSGTSNVTASLTAVKDEWGIIDEANDEIVIPKDGDYMLTVRAASGSTAWSSATATFAIKALKNGSTEISLGAKRAGAAATFVMNIESSIVIPDLKYGDKLELAHSATAATTASYEFEIVRVPDFNTFSVFGEYEYKEVEITADTITSGSADTATDVSGSTISDLTPGKWSLCYATVYRIANTSGSSASLAGQIYITDTSNNRVDASTVFAAQSVVAAAEAVQSTMGTCAEVTITSTTSFKLRIKSATADTTGTMAIRGNSSSSGLTDPDGESKFWARRMQ